MNNKRICLRSYGSKKSSFSERICDDLSEVILQFLPFKDKFRFESVSKQFQRTVYRRQYKLFVNEYKMIKNLKNFETILKKLSNIKSLKYYLYDRSALKLTTDQCLIIINNCNHLTKFEADLSEISEECKQLFAKKFGPQLTSLRISDPSYDSIISSFVNIRDIDLIHYYRTPNEFYTKIKATKVKKVSTRLTYNLDRITHFKTLMNNNRNITHLYIYFDSTINISIDPNLQIFSQLNQLISLQLKGNIDFNSLTNDLKQLLLNCHKLKSLSIQYFERKINFKTNDFMSEIKKFKELKRLGIICDTYIKSQYYVINSMSTGFKNLTHLEFGVNPFELKFNDRIMENIVNFLPNLQNLNIRNEIRVTERTPHILSPLSKLQILKINIIDKSFIHLLKNKIIKNCTKIKSIEIS